jgi:cleavage and polyadenylation specificity factor subunit 2
MNDKIVQSFEVGRYNPFDFKHIKLCRSLSELNQIQTPSKNKLVLASTPDLQCGFARSLFVEWCENPKNTIILTSRSSSTDTLANQLIENVNKKSISIEMKKRVRLEGEELDEYFRIQIEKEKEKMEKIKKSKELESIDESSSSDEESVNGVIGGAGGLDATGGGGSVSSSGHMGKHDLMKIQENKSRFFKHTRKQFPMVIF